MNLDNIRKEFINKGLYAYFAKSELIVGNNFERHDETGINTIQNAFALRQKGNNILVDYAVGQLCREKEFETESALFDFINKNLIKFRMNSYLASVQKQFEYYKSLGDKTFAQLTDEQLQWQPNGESNSIAILVNHVTGNMVSRWTNFLTEDGEKEWRRRDQEFKNILKTREALMSKWEEGWACLFNAINPLKDEDLEREIYIRNMGHTVTEAINRQLAHYSYHIGQIVFLGKLATNENWTSLSIPKGNSESYNAEKFAKPKRTEHFTDDL